MKHTNALIHSTSPYLLQHAHNPVAWQPWSKAAVKRASTENKLLLISIGYAACHWCHVMEHECFEDEAVAGVMNKLFVCIKVDREEQPDVDHYYMSAVQLMNQQGGWPLNVIALPDGRPIWGGTYFPKERWLENLQAVAGFYHNNGERTLEYAAQLSEGIRSMNLGVISVKTEEVNKELIHAAVKSWKTRFDMKEGGRTGAPKFPLPVTLDFLLYYATIHHDRKCLDYTRLSLEKMARGGIYDQLGGGFARYSVDDIWKVPHFEKMLYDNGQLLSLYSKAFSLYKSEEFKWIVYETVDYLEREMLDPSGAFYSSLDADSEGVEGKFYVWKRPELRMILQEDFPLFADYYQLETNGKWEDDTYILTRGKADEDFARRYKLNAEELRLRVAGWKFKLMAERSKRIRPGLDDKTLASWNALVIIGLVDAYNAFNEDSFLNLALRNADFIKREMLKDSEKLYHNWKNGKASVDGFLEDYALVMQAWLALFEATGNEQWVQSALDINQYVYNHFYDPQNGLFLFSEKDNDSVVGNHYQNEDNVLPAANSVMANNLHRLHLIEGNPDFLELARKMLDASAQNFSKYPMAYANWGQLMLKLSEPYFEVVVCGINSKWMLEKLRKDYRPNILWAHCTEPGHRALLKNRFVIEEDLIYVCEGGACQLPVKTVEEAQKLISNERS